MSEIAKSIIEEVVNMTRNLPKEDEALQETIGDIESAVDDLIGRTGLTKGARDVLDERRRQIEDEEFTAEHDDQWEFGELRRAALCYLKCTTRRIPSKWPWDKKWWKPESIRRNLIKAAALIIAEIDRVDRAQKKLPKFKDITGLYAEK